MASVWLLSKRSLQGMDILNVLTDVLYAMEQKKRGDAVDEEEYRERMTEGERLVEKLSATAEAQTSKKPVGDLFLTRVLEEVEKKESLRPTELRKELNAALDAGLKDPSPRTMRLLETTSEVVSKLTLRSVEGLSTSLT